MQKDAMKTDFKQMADLLIDLSFQDKDLETKTKYKNFHIKLEDASYKTRLGRYHMVTHVIELSGMKKQCRKDILITYLHELSHHIETIDSGTTGHGKPFYDIHIKLLKTAIDLEIIQLEDITENKTSKAGNKNKLAKLMYGYKRKSISYTI